MFLVDFEYVLSNSIPDNIHFWHFSASGKNDLEQKTSFSSNPLALAIVCLRPTTINEEGEVDLIILGQNPAGVWLVLI